MDRISTHVLGLDGNGGATLFADYDQYEQDLLAKKVRALVKQREVEKKVRVHNKPKHL
jgi:hypothetical protein